MEVKLPEPKTPRDRQRAAIWARIFLRSYGLLTESEDAAIKMRIRQWAEQQGCR